MCQGLGNPQGSRGKTPLPFAPASSPKAAPWLPLALLPSPPHCPLPRAWLDPFLTLCHRNNKNPQGRAPTFLRLGERDPGLHGNARWVELRSASREVAVPYSERQGGEKWCPKSQTKLRENRSGAGKTRKKNTRQILVWGSECEARR